MLVGYGTNDDVRRLDPVSCRVRNGHAALGAAIAYAKPVKLVPKADADGVRVVAEGGQVELSALKRIITTYGQLNAITYILQLDNGDMVPARDAIIVDGR